MPKGNHGLTLAERPTIFVYLLNTSAKQVVLTFQDESGDTFKPVFLEINPEGVAENIASRSMIASFRLPDDQPPLTVGKNYQWSLTVICGETLQLNDPITDQQFGQVLENSLTDIIEEGNSLNFIQNTEPKFPGIPVLINSPLYINRPPIEELACSEISQPGCVLRIKAPRKMGKSSLLNRVLSHATTLDYKTVYLDFQEAEESVFF